MPSDQRERLRAIRTFPQLVHYLRDELDWPIETDSFEDLVFDYTPEELGIDKASAAKIQEIKRLRPLVAGQPWGIFFVKFEPKRLPVVALRRILSSLAVKKRATAAAAERRAWQLDDMLFISSYGDGDDRQISFAHFTHDSADTHLPTLKVLGWDSLDTALHLDDVADRLRDRLAWPSDVGDLKTWRETWRSAFTLRHREVITTSRALAVELAHLAQAIRDRIRSALAIETELGPIRMLMKAFQEALIHDLSAGDFADMYAQTVAYGLLTARITHPVGASGGDAGLQLPVTNPFLKELMETFLHVGASRARAGSFRQIDFDELGVSEVIDLLNEADMEAVVRDFGDRNPLEDPVIHFYELFLKEYDADKRMQRGVFYTPRPVVSFIVRSVDEILRRDFGLADGLADTTTWGDMAGHHQALTVPAGVDPAEPFVVILDPATGTGTFLVEVIDLIHRRMTQRWRAQGIPETEIERLWNEYVPRHLLPRLHGFELLMAPYAIAHLKIGLKLLETGYRFGSDARVQVYLTNTLETGHDVPAPLALVMPALAKEAEAVKTIKQNRRFSVVIGNPPYAGTSANLTRQARELVEPYRFVDGTRIVEKGALQFEKNLQDDYVKFFAWSESRILATGVGVLALISNSGFLDSPTLRGMRWHLLSSFPVRYVLDLHGSTKRPIAGDKNVFDIQQGVAVSVLCAPPQSGDRARDVHLSDIVGSRDSKYGFLADRSVLSVDWRALVPLPPLLQFLALDEALKSEFEVFTPLTDIMPEFSSGTETGFDALLVGFTKDELEERIRDFTDPSKTLQEVERAYGIGQGTARKLLGMRRQIREDFRARGDSYMIPGMYRVFDRRFYYYKKEYLKTNSQRIMRNLTGGANRALVAFRQQSTQGFHHVFVTDSLGDKNAVSLQTREINYYFPLWLIPDTESLTAGEPTANLSVRYVDSLQGVREEGGEGTRLNPESVFDFAYAVLHSSKYRQRYSDFLRGGFPRLPSECSPALLGTLCRLGSQLVALHLMKFQALDAATVSVLGPRPFLVDKVSWADETVWIDRVRTRGFRGVAEPVWGFRIGGYQVCEKWLKDRKGRALSETDIAHYQKIIGAISGTIRVMQEIDEVIDAHGGWPGAFAPAASE